MPQNDTPAAGSAAKPRPRTVAAAGLLALALGTTALSVLPGGSTAQPAAAPKQDNTAVALQPRAPGGADFADLAARATPAVVGVTVAGRASTADQVAELPPDTSGPDR